jgi:Holliday junction resolvase RusA-like endonuclease
VQGHARVYTPTRSKDFEYLVKIAAQAQMSGRKPLEVPLSVVIEYHVTIPASVSMVRQREMRDGRRLPTTKPDLDNLIKATLDGMNRVVYRDDVFICDLIASKRYSVEPCTWVRVEALDAVSARPTPGPAVVPSQLPIVLEEIAAKDVPF